MRTAIALILVAGAAQSEPAPDIARLSHYMEPVAGCFDAAPDFDAAKACIAVQSGVCMDIEQDGYSTFGMSNCVRAETVAWDELLNVEYAMTRDRARSWDASETQPEYAVRAGALLDAQRVWITFRDAECALAYTEFGAGSMRTLSYTGCALDMTAERAIALRFMFQEM
ncbi:lysozyme inhibitor LprI family protein [Octadecabacter sp. R77987]|uniref:lysozyme inhibitor LprI family protein n=1 Tax=Octadecabacter sp. R77987 TaxID=3093874 RepID=UPI00366D78E3